MDMTNIVNNEEEIYKKIKREKFREYIRNYYKRNVQIMINRDLLQEIKKVVEHINNTSTYPKMSQKQVIEMLISKGIEEFWRGVKNE